MSEEVIYICPDDCTFNNPEEGCQNKSLPDNITLECEGDFLQCPLYTKYQCSEGRKAK